MQTLGFLLAPVLGFYHRFLRFFIRFILLMFMDIPSTFNFLTQLTELGCGFLLLGYVSRIFNILGLLLIFLSCLRFLRSPIGKPLRDDTLKEETEYNNSNNNNNNSSSGSGSREENLEDEVFDVMSLRRMVKSERQRFNAACAEIEKERGAAASAAEEAMAMILRLQSEKSAVEIQATQFRRMVEQKQEYDLEVIESLQWTVEQVESQKNLLERQLGVLRERLRDFLNDHEIQQRLQEQEWEHEQDREREREQENEQEQELEHEQEHEQDAASDVDLDLDLPVVNEDIDRDEDADSGSGFLNFSVEYNDFDAASSQNHSPSQTPLHL
ncbi:probable myosin-binding protein 5 [Vigna umbellata]|uniref:probable myosin-binding protein 5 n=1 Tax=Vigna umbellata TaxID=87088 RepID=UPI001F5ED82A|nr:probable myosin-binding protein 5 [Vigna umbellata]